MVELSDDSDDDTDKAAYPSIQEAMQMNYRVKPQHQKPPSKNEDIRTRFKKDLIELLKKHPEGMSTQQLMSKFTQRFKWSPSKDQLKVKKVWEVLHCEDFSDDIALRGNFVYLKSDQDQDKGIKYDKLSWGKGAVALGEGLGKKGAGLSGMRSLSSSTSSIDSSGRGPPSRQSTPRSSASANVIDLTDDEDRGGVKTQKGRSLVDLTHDMGRSGFISLSSQPMTQNPVRMPAVVQSQSGDSLLNRAIDSDDGARFGVKPISTETFEQKEIRIAPVKLNPHQGARTVQLESVARECIELLSNANEFVSEERISQLLLQRLRLRHIGEAQCQIRYINQISCVNEHLRLLAKVNAYIDAFMRIRSISTLFELQECLTEFSPDKKDFGLLHIGPIQRLPLVYKYFKFPHDMADIPEITTIDILDNLKGYMDKYNKWTSGLDMEEFLNYMVEKYHVENAYILGVRIRSLPLAAQVTFTMH